MENVKRSITELVEVLVSPVNYLAKIQLFVGLSKNRNYIYDHFRKGEVDENLLLHLFRKSVHSNTIKQLLPDVLYYIEPRSISDAVVDFSITYPGEFRETILSLLAHMWLNVRHLELINSCIQTPEAFCKLLYIYAEDIHCSKEKFHRFLCENKHFLMDVDCIALINKQHINISESKLLVLNYLISDESNIS